MVKSKNLARELAIGMLLAILVAALVVHLTGGLVILPIPWSPIPSVLPGFALVVPLEADPDDPGDGGDDGDGPGKDNEDDKRDPDIDVRVWNEDHSKVRLLVTLAGAARTQLQERGAEWLEDVIREAVRRSFADHPLHRPFRRTGHVDPRPPGEHGGSGEARGFDR